MFKKTEKRFLYYKFNNQLFQDTNIWLSFKIIDFGKAILHIINYISMIILKNMVKRKDNLIYHLVAVFSHNETKKEQLSKLSF